MPEIVALYHLCNIMYMCNMYMKLYVYTYIYIYIYARQLILHKQSQIGTSEGAAIDMAKRYGRLPPFSTGGSCQIAGAPNSHANRGEVSSDLTFMPPVGENAHHF